MGGPPLAPLWQTPSAPALPFLVSGPLGNQSKDVSGLEQDCSNSAVPMQYLGSPVKFIFWVSRSRPRPGGLRVSLEPRRRRLLLLAHRG